VIKLLKTFFEKIKGLLNKANMDNQVIMTGALYAKKIPRDGRAVIDLGKIASKVVTTAGVNYLCDSFQSSTGYPMSDFYWHDCSIGTGAEAVGDTALSTGFVEARTTGTQAEGASANIYQTVSTHVFAATGAAITEHGLFSSSDGGTLWDRSLFAPINVSSGDSIQFTYELTIQAGG